MTTTNCIATSSFVSSGEWLIVEYKKKGRLSKKEVRRYDSTIRNKQKKHITESGIYHWPQYNYQMPKLPKDWCHGSLVEIYSRSKSKWLIGVVETVKKKNF